MNPERVFDSPWLDSIHNLPASDLSLHQYAIALFAAVLAGLFSIAANYFAAGFSSERNTIQRVFEYRIQSYAAFIQKLDHQTSPALSQLLSFGSMIQHVVTDSEIQSFEDRAAEFLAKHDAHHLYWQFNAAITPLRLAASLHINRICNDIQLALMQHDDEIEWAAYSTEAARRYRSWKLAQESGSTHGFEERISEEDRLMIPTVAILMQALIDQLRSEMAQSH